jgi:hypothetical protein
MKEKQVLVKIKLLDKFASLEDFEREIELFNQSNKGVIEVTVINPEEEYKTSILKKLVHNHKEELEGGK